MPSIAMSWSRLSDYIQCPYKFKLKYVDRVFPKFDDKAPHIVRGKRIHESLEQVIIKLQTGQALSRNQVVSAHNVMPLITKLFAAYNDIQAESQISVDDKYQPCDWLDSNVYWRAIIDVICISGSDGLVIDWKTGKLREYQENFGQLHLTALIVMMVKPVLQNLRVAYIYVDHREGRDVTITRSDIPKLKEYFDGMHAQVNSDVTFTAKWNQYCKWCEATREQCKFSSKLS